MQIGTWVQWTPPHFHGQVEMTPARGWIVAVEGDWVVMRMSHMRAPASPFGTFHRNDLTLVPEHELVRGGATLLT